jgi:pimeloyl-ACP methyl ester carboxylesterase
MRSVMRDGRRSAVPAPLGGAPASPRHTGTKHRRVYNGLASRDALTANPNRRFSCHISGWSGGVQISPGYVFDNEGVGRTTLRPGTLTISGMGDDTPAFIAALHLNRPDVLGWSMGGFVVQTLAVRHPGSVRRIILCATSSGDGSALPPGGLRTSPPFANFFPPDQDAARLAFISDIHRYRGFYLAPAVVIQRQQMAQKRWGEGLEPAGHHLDRLIAPALIGDGAEDPYDPIANSRNLAREVPHAQLHIYPDAAHVFWYQDATDWIQRIDRFLR